MTLPSRSALRQSAQGANGAQIANGAEAMHRANGEGAAQSVVGATSITAEDRRLDTASAEVDRRRREVPRPQDELSRLRHELAQAHRDLAMSRLELLEARHAARSDALTGLPNRRGFDSASARALAGHEAAPGVLALMFVDLDGFKAINDRLGHMVGDELLQTVGARLSHAVRRGDLVCRQGGDEFLCLLPALRSRARALAIARTLMRVISAPCQVGPHTVRMRASIGVALYPRDGATMGELLRRADEAMYAAKSRGCGVAMAAPAHHGDGASPVSRSLNGDEPPA